MSETIQCIRARCNYQSLACAVRGECEAARNARIDWMWRDDQQIRLQKAWKMHGVQLVPGIPYPFPDTQAGAEILAAIRNQGEPT